MQKTLAVYVVVGLVAASPAELLFHVPFDGSADAAFAKGAATPTCAENLSFAEGRRGKAVRLTRAAKSVLAYAAPGNLMPDRGTVSLWFKREWPDGGYAADGHGVGRDLFACPSPSGTRIGGGRIWFDGLQLRADVGSPRTWGGAPEDDWMHLAVTWDESGVHIFVNGRAPDDTGDDLPPMKMAVKQPSSGLAVCETFCVGCRGGTSQFDGLVDDLRIYSAPLTREQIRELYHRETVIDIRATGLWAVAGKQSVIEARATSPAGCDLSSLHWCLCDASGTVVTSWRKQSVDGHVKRLKMNLPAGSYRLKATDGTWFYGDVSVNVFRSGNPYARALPPVEIHEPPDPKAESGVRRFWRDVGRREFSQATVPQRMPRRAVVRRGETLVAGTNGRCPDDFESHVDRTAAHMKHVGENVLAIPCFWHHGTIGARGDPRYNVPDSLGAWYAKFDCEGLGIYPTISLDSLLVPDGHGTPSDFNFRNPKVQRSVGHMIDVLLDQSASHPSFRGVCLRIPRGDQCGQVLGFCAREEGKLAERRPGLRLWIDCADPADVNGKDARRDFVEPLRHGDALELVKGGVLGDASGAADAYLPFVQAFRALPAVMFDDVGAPGTDAVRLRQKTYEGKSWFYVVNTGSTPARVKLEVPSGTRDLVADKRVGGFLGAKTLEFVLNPYEMRAYAAREGSPRWLK